MWCLDDNKFSATHLKLILSDVLSFGSLMVCLKAQLEEKYLNNYKGTDARNHILAATLLATFHFNISCVILLKPCVNISYLLFFFSPN